MTRTIKKNDRGMYDGYRMYERGNSQIRTKGNKMAETLVVNTKTIITKYIGFYAT